MVTEFTDAEYAVIYDSLVENRDRIKALTGGNETPNIDSAIEKFGRWAKPSGCEFTVVTGDDAEKVRS